MKHLLSGPLPGCESLEQAEEHHRLDAMQMGLRERRVLHPERHVSVKEVERHMDALREVDRDIYITHLYTTSRMGVVFSHLSDEQLRNALRGISLALDLLYGDHDVIRPAVSQYRYAELRATDDMLRAVRERVTVLLPRMLSIVSKHAKKDIEIVPRTPIEGVVMDARTGELTTSEYVYTGGTPAQASLPSPIAEAALRLHTLAYQRHPIDLLREISNWLTEMEHSE